MSNPRRTARTLAMQALFQLDHHADDDAAQVDAFLNEQCDESGVVEYAQKLVRGASEHKVRFDRYIDQAAQNWSIERITGVDRNIVRVALFEMLACEDPPAKVAINEAIEIAKEFGTKQSPQFVNGVLDAIWKEHQPAGPAVDTVRGEAEGQG